jgi:hypothetical protein
MRYLKGQPFDQPVEWPTWVDPLAPMPSEEEGCAAEAARRLLPELRKLNRYEARAFAIKTNALREVSLRMSGSKVNPRASDGSFLQNEPNSVEKSMKRGVSARQATQSPGRVTKKPKIPL